MKKLSWHLLRLALAITVVASLALSQTSQAPSSSISSGEIVRINPGLDKILAPGSNLETLKVEGFDRGEGPVWVREGKAGYLLFSSGANNRIYEWKPNCFKYPCPTDAGTLSVYMEHAGYKDPSMVGTKDHMTGMPLHGTNGLYLDLQGRLLIDANGDRAVERVEKDGSRTVLGDRYEGKHFGCPNDIVVKSDGAIYFTDSGGGCISGGENGPNWQLKEHGVYLIKDGMLTMLDHDTNDAPPNGIVLSPDGKTLYVTNAPKRREIFAYDVQPDDTVKNRRIFTDLSGETGLGGPDGTKLDKKANFYTAATGGLWIFAPDGKRLGKVPAPDGIRFANLAFGDPDGSRHRLSRLGFGLRIPANESVEKASPA